MHFCADELYMLLNLLNTLPFLGVFVTRLRAWVHDRFACKHHHAEDCQPGEQQP